MFGNEGESGKQRSILSSPPSGSDEETEEFVIELDKICSIEWWSSPDPEGSAMKSRSRRLSNEEWWSSPDPEGSAMKVISDSNIESPVLNQPIKPIPKPKPNTSPNTRLNLNLSSLTINLNTKATQNLPSLSYPNAKTPANQTRPSQVINQNTATPEPLPNKPFMNTNPYLIKPKPWPDEPPILPVPKPRTSTNATHTTETLSRILQQTQRGKTHQFHLLNVLNSNGQVRTSPVASKARIRAHPMPHTSDMFLQLYDFQSLKVGMSTTSRATFANAVHLHSANNKLGILWGLSKKKMFFRAAAKRCHFVSLLGIRNGDVLKEISVGLIGLAGALWRTWSVRLGPRFGRPEQMVNKWSAALLGLIKLWPFGPVI
ncbi:hypothetical protein QYF36_016703 [Acer negundo]|nr:hypothetical protein QYF36_016703 [Acer negundo]